MAFVMVWLLHQDTSVVRWNITDDDLLQILMHVSRRGPLQGATTVIMHHSQELHDGLDLGESVCRQ